MAEVTAFRAAVDQLANPVLGLLAELDSVELTAAEFELGLPLVDFAPFAALPAGAPVGLAAESGPAPRPGSSASRVRPSTPSLPRSGVRSSSPAAGAEPDAGRGASSVTPFPVTTRPRPGAAPSASPARVRLRPPTPPSSVPGVSRPEPRSETRTQPTKVDPDRPAADDLAVASTQSGAAALSSSELAAAQRPTTLLDNLAAAQRPATLLDNLAAAQRPATLLDNLAAELWAATQSEPELLADHPATRTAELSSVRPQLTALASAIDWTELESVIPPPVQTAEEGLLVLASLVDELLASSEEFGAPARPEARRRSLERPANGPLLAPGSSEGKATPGLSSGDLMPAAALRPPDSEAAGRATAAGPDRMTSQVGHPAAPHLPLDPDDLAELVNEALVEQALRHGVDLL